MAEFKESQPKRLAPELTAEERRAMPPLDLISRFIMPRLFDKVNDLEWRMKKELFDISARLDELELADVKRASEFTELRTRVENISQVNTRLLTIIHDGEALPEGAKAPKATKKKAVKKPDEETTPRPTGCEADIKSPVIPAEIMDYDPDKDEWKPKVVDGEAITGQTIKEIKEGRGDHSLMTTAFVSELSDDEVAVLDDMFPAEESF